MRAKIIAKDHTVLTYTVNRYPRHIVEKRKQPSTRADKEVFHAIDIVGFKWADVANYFDQFPIDTSVPNDRIISRHTIL